MNATSAVWTFRVCHASSPAAPVTISPVENDTDHTSDRRATRLRPRGSPPLTRDRVFAWSVPSTWGLVGCAPTYEYVVYVAAGCQPPIEHTHVFGATNISKTFDASGDYCWYVVAHNGYVGASGRRRLSASKRPGQRQPRARL